VNQQFDRYAEGRHNIENYRNGVNLSLFGIGGAAGVNAVTKGSKEGLQTLGLAAAGIVGLDGVLKVDEQHATFGAGVDALRCVANLDLSKDGARQSIFGSPARQAVFTTQGTLDSVSLGTSVKAFGDLGSLHYNTFSAAVTKSRSNPEALALISEAYQQRMAALGELKHQFSDWYAFLNNIASETDEQRANNLLFALNDIRKAVSDRLLYSNKDISGVYDALKGAMAKATPKPPAAAPGTGGTNPKAATAMVLATESADITNIRALLDHLQKSTEDYKETYKACLALATAKGSGTGSGSGGGSGGSQ
jgi:hypothetical protein